jgi:hypothetical protein
MLCRAVLCPLQIFDFGTAVVYPDPFSMHTAVDPELHETRPDAAPQLAEQRPHNRRGKINDREAAERYASGYEYRWVLLLLLQLLLLLLVVVVVVVVVLVVVVVVG